MINIKTNNAHPISPGKNIKDAKRVINNTAERGCMALTNKNFYMTSFDVPIIRTDIVENLNSIIKTMTLP